MEKTILGLFDRLLVPTDGSAAKKIPDEKKKAELAALIATSADEVRRVDNLLRVDAKARDGKDYFSTGDPSIATLYGLDSSAAKEPVQAPVANKQDTPAAKEDPGAKGTPESKKPVPVKVTFEEHKDTAGAERFAEEEKKRRAQAAEKPPTHSGSAYSNVLGDVSWRREEFKGLEGKPRIVRVGEVSYLFPSDYTYIGTDYVPEIPRGEVMDDKMDGEVYEASRIFCVGGKPVFPDSEGYGKKKKRSFGSWTPFAADELVAEKLDHYTEAQYQRRDPLAANIRGLGNFEGLAEGELGSEHLVCMHPYNVTRLRRSLSTLEATYETEEAAAEHVRQFFAATVHVANRPDMAIKDHATDQSKERRYRFDRIFPLYGQLNTLANMIDIPEMRDESLALGTIVFTSAELPAPRIMAKMDRTNPLLSDLELGSAEEGRAFYSQVCSGQVGGAGAAFDVPVPDAPVWADFARAVAILILIPVGQLRTRGEAIINCAYNALGLKGLSISSSPGAALLNGTDADALGRDNNNGPTFAALQVLFRRILRDKANIATWAPRHDRLRRNPVYMMATAAVPEISANVKRDRHSLDTSIGNGVRNIVMSYFIGMNRQTSSVQFVYSTMQHNSSVVITASPALGQAIIYGDYEKMFKMWERPVNPMSLDSDRAYQFIRLTWSGALAFIRHGLGDTEMINEHGDRVNTGVYNRPPKPMSFAKYKSEFGLSLLALQHAGDILRLLALGDPRLWGRPDDLLTIGIAWFASLFAGFDEKKLRKFMSAEITKMIMLRGGDARVTPHYASSIAELTLHLSRSRELNNWSCSRFCESPALIVQFWMGLRRAANHLYRMVSSSHEAGLLVKPESVISAAANDTLTLAMAASMRAALSVVPVRMERTFVFNVRVFWNAEVLEPSTKRTIETVTPDALILKERQKKRRARVVFVPQKLTTYIQGLSSSVRTKSFSYGPPQGPIARIFEQDDPNVKHEFRLLVRNTLARLGNDDEELYAEVFAIRYVEPVYELGDMLTSEPKSGES
jgi:hypothetical protein